MKEQYVQPKLIIVEEVYGNYFYHIAKEDSFTKALCGSPTIMMPTEMPMHTWGFRGHLRERYCEECKEKYDDMLVTEKEYIRLAEKEVDKKTKHIVDVMIKMAKKALEKRGNNKNGLP